MYEIQSPRRVGTLRVRLEVVSPSVVIKDFTPTNNGTMVTKSEVRALTDKSLAWIKGLHPLMNPTPLHPSLSDVHMPWLSRSGMPGWFFAFAQSRPNTQPVANFWDLLFQQCGAYYGKTTEDI